MIRIIKPYLDIVDPNVAIGEMKNHIWNATEQVARVGPRFAFAL